MKTKKTYSQLLGTIQIINAILQSDSTTLSAKKLTKIGKLLQPKLDEYNDKLEDIRLDSCSTDDKGNLILDEQGGYTYNKNGRKNLNKALRELLTSEFDFEPIQATSSIGLENFLFLEGFVTGVDFVVPEQVEELEEVEL